jgi:hypothetical protein
MPDKLRCGSGFVASTDQVTRQQDIIVYDRHSLPVLLEIGDCVVVDAEAAAATLEVKTVLDSGPALSSALEKLFDFKSAVRGACFVGLYAWEGMSLERALECIWERYRRQRDLSMSSQPNALYVRGNYLLMPNYDGRLDTAPLLLLRLGSEHHSEGAGLLSLVERMWTSGLQSHAKAPWWIRAWDQRMTTRYEHVAWPSDRRARVDAQLAARAT